MPQEFNFNQFEKGFDIVVNQAGYYGLPPELARERAEKYLRALGLWDKRDVPSTNAVRRHEAPPDDRPRPGARAEAADSRRTHRRGRYRNASLHVGFPASKINAEGTTIILTTHYLEEAEALCRNIAIINHGEIVEHSSIKDLLRRLHREVFILDCVEELPESLAIRRLHGTSHRCPRLEVEVEKGQFINEVFLALERQGIHINSMRNRANRLEEMFVNLVEGAA